MKTIGFKRQLPDEEFRRGEPDLRPEADHTVVSRTPAMAGEERRPRNRALLATIMLSGTAPSTVVSMEAMVDAVTAQCGLAVGRVTAKVIPAPAHALLTFKSRKECTFLTEM